MSIPSVPTSLHGGAEIIDFFRQQPRSLFYVSTTAYNLLGADEWIANLRFINTVDSFDGRHPNVFTAAPASGSVPSGIDAANCFLLSNLQVDEYVRRARPNAGVLFLMFEQKTEDLAHALGLTVAHPPAWLRQQLDSKTTTTRLAARAGILSVPNVLTPVNGYRHLREVASVLGPDLVVQLPYGDSGATTFFISCEADYRLHADEIEAQAEVKVMKRIRCRQLTIEGCVTRQGTLAGPLMTEMVGYPQLTPFEGGWCGNEVFALNASTLLSAGIRREAQRAVLALGEQLRQEGYWGCFGLDFLLDQDSGALYLGELNPRLTGVTPLMNQAAHDRLQPPLLLFHLLEWLGIDFSFDSERFHRIWLEAGPALDWSQLIIEHVRDEPEILTEVPASGVWRLQPDGELHFVGPGFHPEAISGSSEAFFMRTVDAGCTVFRGASLGRLTLRERVVDDDYRLTPRAAAWICGFRSLFDSSAKRALATESSGSM